MKQIQKGFTLIELMIVVAIIGILAAVAIPAYQDYVVKSKLAKVVTSIDSIKMALALYYQEQGSFPHDPNTASNAVVTFPTTQSGAQVGVWNSLGLTTVSLPPEVTKIIYDSTANGDNYGLSMTFTGIRAGTIDGQSVAIGPINTNSVAAGGANTLTASGIAGSQTTLPQFWSCSTSLDVIAKKFFNNAGVPC